MSMGSTLDSLFGALPILHDFHAPSGPVYELLKRVVSEETERRFGPDSSGPQGFGPFGEVVFPFHGMGAITSVDLFGLDELIIFSFYWTNRHRYQRVADIGANLGLHSIILERCGCKVRAYEPDPAHFQLLSDNLASNACERIQSIQAAVSIAAGEQEFIRVLGNTTGSHLVGAKPSPYGELERFPVRLTPIGPIVEWADLLKVDAEGHEASILTATTAEQWDHTDAILEVGNRANADVIFRHFRDTPVNLFAQKIQWGRVTDPRDMPESYKDGSLFLSVKQAMPWARAE